MQISKNTLRQAFGIFQLNKLQLPLKKSDLILYYLSERLLILDVTELVQCYIIKAKLSKRILEKREMNV